MKQLTCFVLILTAGVLFARSPRVDQVPNGSRFSCSTCHNGQGGPRNVFGQTIESSYLDQPGSSGKVLWGADLARLDSDGDGAANGVELQDADGSWQEGSDNPGDRGQVTNPGNPSSVPQTAAAYAAVPASWQMHQNYPNPFNSYTHIHYSVPEPGSVSVQIINAAGRLIYEERISVQSAGSHRFQWHGRTQSGAEVETGVFICVMRFGNELKKQKMIYLK